MLKKVTSEYGATILESVVVVAVLSLIFFLLPAGNGTYGLGNVLSSKVNSDGIDYSTYSDSAATASVLGRARPELTYYPYDDTGAKIKIVAGNDVTLSKFFQCTDAEGVSISNIKITSITDKSGTELLADRLTETDTFRFSKAGVYEVNVVATDSKNQSSTRKFLIPVTNKRQEV